MRKLVLMSTVLLISASSFGQSSPDSVSGNSALQPNNAVRSVFKKREIEMDSKGNPSKKMEKQKVYNDSLADSERSESIEANSPNPAPRKRWASSKVPSVAQRQPR